MSSAREAGDIFEYLSLEGPASVVADTPPGEVRLLVGADEFNVALEQLRTAGARFVTLFLAETPDLALTAVVALRGELVLLQTLAQETGCVRWRALADWWRATAWPERELLERDDRAQIDRCLEGHSLTRPDADLIDRSVSGLDVFAIPYGPVRSGIFEAIQFQIETGGEDITHLQTRPFFKHRGIEARFTGMDPENAVIVAERVAGIASNAYASAFSEAVERVAGVSAPRRAQRWRAVYCELERMACHLDVIAKEAETTALYVGQARFQILKESVQRIRAQLTGSRFGRGMIVPGGVRAEGELSLEDLSTGLDALARDLRRDCRMFLGTPSMTDRLIGSGRLDRAVTEERCAVGPLARGSGISTDARHERPYGAYARLGVRVMTDRGGDAMARMSVRFAELFESLRLVRQTTEQLRRHDGELLAAIPEHLTGTACGWAEAPQGELVFWVEMRNGAVHRVHIASPSLRNWALFDGAFPNDVLTDFAFIEHSFGLTPAGADR